MGLLTLESGVQIPPGHDSNLAQLTIYREKIAVDREIRNIAVCHPSSCMPKRASKKIAKELSTHVLVNKDVQTKTDLSQTTPKLSAAIVLVAKDVQTKTVLSQTTPNM